MEKILTYVGTKVGKRNLVLLSGALLASTILGAEQFFKADLSISVGILIVLPFAVFITAPLKSDDDFELAWESSCWVLRYAAFFMLIALPVESLLDPSTTAGPGHEPYMYGNLHAPILTVPLSFFIASGICAFVSGAMLIAKKIASR